ncbi:L-seryl-tRNA(Sec) selenium transferase [Helicobacter sp. 12S02634-8]|uniref:L-seryl-tRNA(Sec) selenium transferase n=1 Tax=Helicobacter sp. 12S02634-8 TaxID=1476199 RepID=UPI00209C1967|nr:L-seryl-tRNA(Sec) selenium transferase [Helicobacter sp. 12S02634-8]
MREALSQLPKIDKLLKEPRFQNKNPSLLKRLAQELIESLRQGLCQGQPLPSYAEILAKIDRAYCALLTPSSKPLINATGIILQTNLGRSIFSPKLLEKITPLLSGYNNLEYNLATGERGERYASIQKLLCALLGCEDVLVVNNNASAVLLITNTFAKDKEVIISRGELIEIGGSFRIPEVIISAGAHLKEVGTTNKTYLRDYQNAITQDSALIIKAHQSNFKQIGFVQEVCFEDLSKLAQAHHLIDYYDVGSGYITPIDGVNEASLIAIAAKNPSLVSFSGDKLLGGPQAGIIFGKKHLIDQLKKNHLLRALRVDKFTIFALSATLQAYIEGDLEMIPTQRMLHEPLESLRQKAEQLAQSLNTLSGMQCVLTPLGSMAGGGALPQEEFPSYGIALSHMHIKTQALNEKIRQNGLIARIQNDKILLDMRCLEPHHLNAIKQIFLEVLNAK